MDSKTRSSYASLSNDDWIKLGYLREDDLGLTGNIHPLFQRINTSRPSGAEHIWPQYKSEDDYESMCAEMGTVLRMASNMLETPQSLDFLYQVAFSSRKVSRNGSSNQGRPCKEFGWNEPPNFGRGMAKDALRRLSRSLTFQIGDPETNPAVRGSFAVTASTLVSFPQGVKINDAGKPGTASRITLNQDYILALRYLMAQEGDTTSQRKSLEFKMAQTLGHEVVVSTTKTAGPYPLLSGIRVLTLKSQHALAHATDNELLEMSFGVRHAMNQASREGRAYQSQIFGTQEPFYRNETMAELGCCWENQVFGGKITWSTKTSDPLFVSKWPSFFSSEHDYPTRGNEKSTARKYVVSHHYIRNMHRQSFWDNVKPDHKNALYIKKTIGIEYHNPDAEAVSVDSSRVNWPTDENSSRVFKDVSDPSESHANEMEEERRARKLASKSGL